MIQKVGSRIYVVDSPLERENPRSSVRHRLTLERRLHTSRSFAGDGTRSSAKLSARAEGLQSKVLGDGKTRSSVKTPARAYKQQRRARSSVKTSARA